MKKFFKIFSLSLGLFLLSSTKTLAISSYSSSSSNDSASALFGISYIVCIGCSCIIGIIASIFTILMIVDVLKKDEIVLPNKTMWLVLLVVGLLVGYGFIAALIYYFTDKKKSDLIKDSNTFVSK